MIEKGFITKQYSISPAAGKRLIAKSLLRIPAVLEALEHRTVVVISGTTNGYVADEMLMKISQTEGFVKERFVRGITVPPGYEKTNQDLTGNEGRFIGDVVIINGKWEKGKTIYDVADQLKMGDMIFKGANAVNLSTMQAAILIGNPAGGTISPILQCVIGKRVELYLPVGLEKRISGNINEISAMLNSPDTSGLRYMPVNGNIITELEAIKIICGAGAELVACGGVCGAESTYWIAVTGSAEQLGIMDELYKSIRKEPNYFL